MDASAIVAMVPLLRDDEENIRKEAAWALSNIFAGNLQQIQEGLKAGALGELLYILDDVSFSIILYINSYFSDYINSCKIFTCCSSVKQDL